MGQHDNFATWFGNAISGAAIVGTIAGWLPSIAAIVALVWYLIQIYESATVQRWMATRRHRRLAKLKARVILMEAQGKPPLLPFQSQDRRDDGPEAN